MIKTILAIAMVAMVFTGCVGTLVADNNVKSSSIRNAKCTTNENNNTAIKVGNIQKKVKNKVENLK